MKKEPCGAQWGQEKPIDAKEKITGEEQSSKDYSRPRVLLRTAIFLWLKLRKSSIPRNSFFNAKGFSANQTLAWWLQTTGTPRSFSRGLRLRTTGHGPQDIDTFGILGLSKDLHDLGIVERRVYMAKTASPSAHSSLPGLILVNINPILSFLARIHGIIHANIYPSITVVVENSLGPYSLTVTLWCP